MKKHDDIKSELDLKMLDLLVVAVAMYARKQIPINVFIFIYVCGEVVNHLEVQ